MSLRKKHEYCVIGIYNKELLTWIFTLFWRTHLIPLHGRRLTNFVQRRVAPGYTRVMLVGLQKVSDEVITVRTVSHCCVTVKSENTILSF